MSEVNYAGNDTTNVALETNFDETKKTEIEAKTEAVITSVFKEVIADAKAAAAEVKAATADIKAAQEKAAADKAAEVKAATADIKAATADIKAATADIKAAEAKPAEVKAPAAKEPSFTRVKGKNAMIKHFPAMKRNNHKADHFDIDTKNGVVITIKGNEYHVYNGKSGQVLSGAIKGNYAEAVKVAKNFLNG